MRAALPAIACLLAGSFAACGQGSSAPPLGAKAPAVVVTATATTASTSTCTFVAMNDFHGHVSTPPGRWGVATIEGREVPVGGAAYLATHVSAMDPKASLFVSAGDLFGASPLVSSLYRDEPTIEAMNAIGLRFDALGNHEFDQGVPALMRLAYGAPAVGNEPAFAGAKFPFLGANVGVREATRAFAPTFTATCPEGGGRIGFIGLPLRGVKGVTTLGNDLPVDFGDEVEAVNRETAKLADAGVRAIVVVIHEGGTPSGTDPNACGIEGGHFREMVERFDTRVRVVLSGHSHRAYVCTWGGRLVTSAEPYGRMLTHVRFTMDASGAPLRAEAKNVYVTHDVAPQPAVSEIVGRYEARAKPERDRFIGRITATFSDKLGPSGESPLGNFIADAQLAATRDPKRGGARVAFMNPGGVRADLPAGTTGAVTFEQCHAVQPFGNQVVTMTLTGAQIVEMLEAQFQERKARILFPSHGFTYAYDATKPRGSRVSNVRLEGKALDAKVKVRVTVNSFLAKGGDGFTVLEKGTDRVTGPTDLEALLEHLRGREPSRPPEVNRIQRLDAAP